MKDKPMIRVAGLHKYFDDLEVLKGVDLSVYPGEVVSIIGGSGSGKSTLLRCINFFGKEKIKGISTSEQKKLYRKNMMSIS